MNNIDLFVVVQTYTFWPCGEMNLIFKKKNNKLLLQSGRCRWDP